MVKFEETLAIHARIWSFRLDFDAHVGLKAEVFRGHEPPGLLPGVRMPMNMARENEVAEGSGCGDLQETVLGG